MIRAAFPLGYVLILLAFSLVPQTNVEAQILRACRSRSAGTMPVRTTLPASAQKTSDKSDELIRQLPPSEIPAPESKKLRDSDAGIAAPPEPAPPEPESQANMPDSPGVGPAMPVEPQNDPDADDISADIDKSSSCPELRQAIQMEYQPLFSGPAIPSGVRVSLLVSFLGDQTGYVLLDCVGVTIQCEIIDWRESSVTLQIPRWGVQQPKIAKLRIVRADGRIADQVPFLLVPAPDVVIHSESVPAPLPARPE